MAFATCSSTRAPPRKTGAITSTRVRRPAVEAGIALCPLWPGSAGQNEPVSVGVCDRDAPPFPVWIARIDPHASRIDQAGDHIVIDHSIEIENQQVLLGRRRWCRTIWVTDKLQVPRCTRPSDHEQRMPAAGRVVGPEQDIEPEPVHPEPLGGTQIMARPGNTQVTCWQRLHCSSCAIPRQYVRTSVSVSITTNRRLGYMLAPRHDDDRSSSFGHNGREDGQPEGRRAYCRDYEWLNRDAGHCVEPATAGRSERPALRSSPGTEDQDLWWWRSGPTRWRWPSS